MPLLFLSQVVENGINAYPHLVTALKIAPWLGILYLLKRYFNGGKNGSERLMHGKIVLVTVSVGQ